MQAQFPYSGLRRGQVYSLLLKGKEENENSVE
jgi:hypothetical protein